MFECGVFQTTRKYMSAEPESFPFVEEQTGIVLITNYMNLRLHAWTVSGI